MRLRQAIDRRDRLHGEGMIIRENPCETGIAPRTCWPRAQAAVERSQPRFQEQYVGQGANWPPAIRGVLAAVADANARIGLHVCLAEVPGVERLPPISGGCSFCAVEFPSGVVEPRGTR